MKPIKLLISTLFILTCFIQAQNKFRKLSNQAFDVGEKLTFEVSYGFVTAGIAEMEIPKMKRISGRNAYQITFKVNSVSAFDSFYKVRDKYLTYLDAEGLFPWRFEQHIREGGFSRDFSAFFDQKRKIAHTSEGKHKIPKYVQDIVSAFYYVRTQDFSNFKKGDKIELANFYKDKTYPLEVVYHGTETVEVQAGKFDCIIVEPLVAKGGLFKSEGNILIWLTNDKNKIPVKVKTKIIIGDIYAELIKYKGLKN